MSNYNLDIVSVSCRTPELIEIMIKSFQKFVTDDFKLRFIIIENSNENLTEKLSSDVLKNTIVVNNNNSLSFSEAHGSGLEVAKSYLSLDSDYVFTCHSDTCVVSKSFFKEIKTCIDDEIFLAGVCEDKVSERVKALHCSGLLVKSSLYKKISMMPVFPKIDTADLLTVYCRENNLKMKLFKNTYNDENLVDACNSPFRELGKDCGVDRCLDSKNNVMFIHQGRGTTKYSNTYMNPKKIATTQWLNICKDIVK